MTHPFIIPAPPEGEHRARVEFPEDMEGHGIAHYEVTEKPPLRRGMAPRFLVWLVHDATGNCLNNNLPVATEHTLDAAIARAKVGFEEDEQTVEAHEEAEQAAYEMSYADAVQDEIARDNRHLEAERLGRPLFPNEH